MCLGTNCLELEWCRFCSGERARSRLPSLSIRPAIPFLLLKFRAKAADCCISKGERKRLIVVSRKESEDRLCLEMGVNASSVSKGERKRLCLERRLKATMVFVSKGDRKRLLCLEREGKTTVSRK